MKVNERYYPHPVLSPFSDDILNSIFRFSLDLEVTREFYCLSVTTELTNKNLLEYIENKKAIIALHIECPNTRTREMFHINFPKDSIKVPSDILNGKVEISCFVISEANMYNYSNDQFHPDYDGAIFNVFKGDVLAVAEGKQFFAEKEKDELRNIPSIFTVWKDESRDAAPYNIDFDNKNKIVIRLSKENFDYYGQLSQNSSFSKLLASLILLPALVSLLETLKREDFSYDQYEDAKWFRTIDNKLKLLGINLKAQNQFSDSTAVVAQQLIGNPLSGALKDLFDNASQE